MKKTLLFMPALLLFLYSCQEDDPSFPGVSDDPENEQTGGNQETVTDYDGNVYPVVRIGRQVWMAENLRVTHYADGTPIPFVEDGQGWIGVNNPQKAFCWYNDDPKTGEIYGALYNYSAAMNGADSSSAIPSGVQGVCPEGWHLPSDGEWKQLELHLGMNQDDADHTGWRGTDEGGMLKETGTGHWHSPNFGATNSTGFRALPGGERSYDGKFHNGGLYARFWSATMKDYYICYRSLSYDGSWVGRHHYCHKNIGYSVRCVKN